jgi:arylsulfatase A-like enzyme
MTRQPLKRYHPILIYAYLGLVFLLWENTISSLLGIYHLELRRTLAGVVYYILMFVVFGGVAEVLALLCRRFLPRIDWPGSRYTWLLTLVLLAVWYRVARLLLTGFLNIYTLFGTIAIILLILATALLFGYWINRRFARHFETGVHSDFTKLFTYSFGLVLFATASTKIMVRYFPYNVVALHNLVVLVLLLIASVLITWALSRWMGSMKSLNRFLLLTPIVVTAMVVVLPAIISGKYAESSSSRENTAHRPNVIILLFDALRADHVGACGGAAGQTPFIDSLALRGRAYSNCYSTSSWTFPTMVSLLTSQFPNRMQLSDRGQLAKDVPTLVDVLRSESYECIGLSANVNLSPLHGFARSFDRFRLLPPKGPKQLLFPTRIGPLDIGYGPIRLSMELAYQLDFMNLNSVAADWRQMNALAIDVLEDHNNKPTFLYMHYIEPHQPYYTEPLSGCILDLEMLSYPILARLYQHKQPVKLAALESSVIKKLHGRYQQGVRHVDQAVQDMVENLERLGLADNTILVIVSDHGEEFYEHGLWDHGWTLYKEVLEIPLIIIPPQGWTFKLPEQNVDVSIMDIAPTILDLVNSDEKLPNAQGWSLLNPYPHEERPHYLALESPEGLWRGVKIGTKKVLIKDYHETDQIDTMYFDLAVDPGEYENLYEPGNAIIDSLAVMISRETDHLLEIPEHSPDELSREEIKQLRALGYLN